MQLYLLSGGKDSTVDKMQPGVPGSKSYKSYEANSFRFEAAARVLRQTNWGSLVRLRLVMRPRTNGLEGNGLSPSTVGG